MVNARVERLISWNEDRRVSSHRSPAYGLAAGLATLTLFTFTYSHLLLKVHTATEWLMH